MTFLPIVAREMRVAARRRGLHWNRVTVALLALVLAGFIYADFKFSQRGWPEFGQALFFSLGWLAFIFCALAGPRLTAETICEERREGTLGLLFLTDLRGYDIVLGKLAASSLSGVYSLLAIVPILAMTLLFGGVSGTQFGRTVLVLGATMFCSLALGMWVSAGFENGRRAIVVTVALLALLCIGPFLAVWGYAASQRFNLSGPDELPLLWLAASPCMAMGLAVFPMAPPQIADLFWPSVIVVFGLGVLALFLSSVVVPRVWRDRPAGSWRMRISHAWQRLRYGQGASREAFRERWLAHGPVAWLLSRDRLQPAYVWVFLATAAGLFAWSWWKLENGWDDPGIHLTFSQTLYGVLKLWIAALVVARLAEDKRSGAIELLLTAPLRVQDIHGGLRHAVQRQFLAPLLAVLLLDVWFCFRAIERQPYDWDMSLGIYAARGSLLVLDAVTLWRLGPWVAVTARHPNQAAASLLVRVCVLPWLAFLGGTMAFALLDSWRILHVNFSEGGVLTIWFGLGLANDVFWLAFARARMRTHFRAAAAARFERRGWWMKLMAAAGRRQAQLHQRRG